MDFDSIDLFFRSDKKDEELLFSMTTVGESHLQHGMRLRFKNQEATLVIQNIQFSHCGVYRWHLSGQGSSNKFTTLTVSEPPTISKENGCLICRATNVKAGRRIIWSNDLPRRQTEFTSTQDATGLFNLSSSQLWNDSFYSNPPCCKVMDEKGSQELCAQTCYTSAIVEKSSEVKQFPLFIMAQEGDTINITCTTTGKSSGLYLKRSTIRLIEVIHFSKKNKSIITKSYENRTIVSGSLNNLMITITNVQLNDTDVYTCEATTSDNLLGTGTIVVVTEKKWKKEDGNLKNSQVEVVLIVISFFIGLALWPLFMMMKKWVHKVRRTQNPSGSVYEDMSYAMQRNTTFQDNQYS
ncbi:T-cell antigen CD7 isoform X2 [Phascolarctos cinereus]|nr:T-cell antigen CD7 isoform X2 [Phascolarctos cinereus]